MPKDDSRKLREQLVDELERYGAIRSAPVRAAFLVVPRELFVADFAARNGLAAVYRNDAIVTKHSRHGIPLSSSSQPSVMAAMLEQLEVREGMRVLEVGAGTGYNAALLSVLVGSRGRVLSVDVDRDVAAAARRALQGRYAVRVLQTDGREGFPRAAPYDRIIVTASSDTVPRRWHEQLTDQGLLELPLRLDSGGAQAIPVFGKTARGFRSLSVICGGFMPLRGADDDGRPPTPEPCLTVSELGPEGSGSLLQLGGQALATLSASAKRRLVATALEEPRRTPLGLRADRGALALYVSRTLPRRRRVSRAPTYGVGPITRDGRSLALIEAGSGAAQVAGLTAYGTDEAESLLLERVEAWARRGRPSERDLRMTITYGEERPRLSVRWPRRGRDDDM